MKFIQIKDRVINAQYIREIAFKGKKKIVFVLDDGEEITEKFKSQSRRNEEMNLIHQFLGGDKARFPNERLIFESFFQVLPWFALGLKGKA